MKKQKALLILVILAVAFSFAACKTEVVAVPTEVEADTATFKLEYAVGTALDVTGSMLKVTMNDGNVELIPVTAEMVSGFSSQAVGPCELTLTYSGLTAHVSVTITENFIDIMKTSGLTFYDLEYRQNENLVSKLALVQDRTAVKLYTTDKNLTAEDFKALAASDIKYLDMSNALVTGNTLPEGAFKGNASLIGITLPSSLNTISKDAFANCVSLRQIQIPATVTTITENVFKGCMSLQEINVPSVNANFTSASGVLYNRSMSNLLIYPAGKTNAQYELVNGVGIVSQEAFYGAGLLSTVVFPTSARDIKDYAFAKCSALSTVTFNSGMQKIGAYAFSDCIGLTTAIMPDSVNQVGEYCFNNCISLTTLKMPTRFTTINKGLFNGCTALLNFEIGVSVGSVDFSAFYGCTSLGVISVVAGNSRYAERNGVVFSVDKTTLYYYPEGKKLDSTSEGIYYVGDETTIIKSGAFHNTTLISVRLSSVMETVEQDAFTDNVYLNAFSVPNTSANYSVLNDVLFNKEQTKLVRYPEGKADTTYVIPETVTEVAPYAFKGTAIATLTLSNGISAAEDYCYAEMGALDTVNLGSGLQRVTTFAFSGDKVLTTLNSASSKVMFYSRSIPVIDGVERPITLNALVGEGGTFYGWYNSETGGECVMNDVTKPDSPSKLTNAIIGSNSIVLFPRLDTYENALGAYSKGGYELRYYSTDDNSEAQKQALIASIIEDLSVSVTHLNGTQSDVAITSSNLIDLPVSFTELSGNVTIGIQYKHLTTTISLTFKAKDTFTVTYTASEGGTVRLPPEYDDKTTGTLSFTETQGDMQGVIARGMAGYEFSGFIVTEPLSTSRSAYYDVSMLEDMYSITDNVIRVQNVMCALEVKAVFKPLVTVTVTNNQSIESHSAKGGIISVENGGSSNDSLTQKVLSTNASNLFTATPYELYPLGSEGYLSNVDGVYGYVFDKWVFVFSPTNASSVLAEGEVIPTYSIPFYYNKASVDSAHMWSYPTDLSNVSIRIVSEGGVVKPNTFSVTYEYPAGVKYTTEISFSCTLNDRAEPSTAGFRIENASCDVTVGAYFCPYFAVEYRADEGGFVTSSDNVTNVTSFTQYVKYGENALSMVANPDDCYTFVGWWNSDWESLGDSPSRQELNVRHNATYIATFNSLIPTEYVKIATAAGLRAMANDLYANYLLTADIDMANEPDWVPLGNDTLHFYGMLDGQGYSIKNITISAANDDRIGFFGILAGEVRNVKFENVTLNVSNKTTSVYVGSVVGYMTGGSISACSAEGVTCNVSSAKDVVVGGLAGMVSDGVISNCWASGTIVAGATEGAMVGGIAGTVNGGYVFNSYTAILAYSKGATNCIGGIVGELMGAVLKNCRYVTDVEDTLSGVEMYSKARTAVFSTKSNTGSTNNAGITAEEMRNATGFDGWLDELWIFEEGSYPKLDDEVPLIEIYDESDLLNIQLYPSGEFILMNDLYLENGWSPVPYFSGTLDGNEHTLDNVEIIGETKNIGLFAKMGAGAVVKNLAIKNLYIQSNGGSVSIGGIAGSQSGGVIFAVSVSGTILAQNTTTCHIGGIVGIIDVGGAINNVYSLVNISSVNGQDDKLGGLIGLIKQGAKDVNIKYCFSASVVYAEDNLNNKTQMGGLIGGSNSTSSQIQNNFYILDNIVSVDSEYTVPNDIFGPNYAVPDDYGMVTNNLGYNYAQMPDNSFSDSGKHDFGADGWNNTLWVFVANLIPHLSFETDFFLPDPVGGNGTKVSPFQISTYEQLCWLKTFNRMHVKLGANIECSGREWEAFSFSGSLIGNGFSINNLTISKSKQGGAALFSEMNSGALTGLNLLNVNYNVTDKNDMKVAGLVLRVKSGVTITNCSVTGTMNVTSTDGNLLLGGIAAEIIGNNGITDCYTYVNASVGTPYGTQTVGGIAGSLFNSRLTNTYSDGSYVLLGRTIMAGGIVGEAGTTLNASQNVTRVTMATTDVSLTVQGAVNTIAYVGGIIGSVPTNDIYSECKVLVDKCAVLSGTRLTLGAQDTPSVTEKLAVVNFGGLIGRMLSRYCTMDSSYVLNVFSVPEGVVINNQSDHTGTNVGMFLGWSGNFDDGSGNYSNITNSFFESTNANTALNVAIGTATTALTDMAVMPSTNIGDRVAMLLAEDWTEYQGMLAMTDDFVLSSNVIEVAVGGSITAEPTYMHTYSEYESREVIVNKKFNGDLTTAGIYVLSYSFTFVNAPTAGTMYAKVFIVCE